MSTTVLSVSQSPPANYLADRSVLVTGAADGIGRATAIAAARAGAEVILLDRVVRKLETVYDEICELNASEPGIYPLDLEGATPEHYQELAQRLAESTGGLDVLVHNAARLGVLSPIEHYEPTEWAKVLQVNLNAPFLLTQACLPLLRSNGHGRLLFVSDRVGAAGKAYWGAYCVSKFGLEGLMQLTADELEVEAKVSVMSIDPGVVATSLRANAFPSENRDVLRTPQAMAGALVHLMGAAGKAYHGQRIELTDE